MCGSDEEHKQCARKNNPFENGKFMELVGGQESEVPYGDNGNDSNDDIDNPINTYITVLEKDGVKTFRCDYNECGREFKKVGNLTSHQNDFHKFRNPIDCYSEVVIDGIRKHICEISGCGKVVKSKQNIKNHLKFDHNILQPGEQLVSVNCSVCNEPFQTKYSLTRHLKLVHQISEGEIEKYTCGQCGYETFRKGDYDSHMREQHEISDKPIETFPCPVENCPANPFKRKEHLNTHLREQHAISNEPIELFKCSHEGCDFESKREEGVKTHMARVHKISDKPLPEHHCPIEGCDYKTVYKASIENHLKNIHNYGNENVEMFKCPIENCDYESKQKIHLKTHLEGVHDIGEHQCDYCAKNRNSHIEYNDKNGGTVHICRECYNKAIGKTISKEKQWGNYLNKHFGTEYLLSSDMTLKSQGGCSRKKPDKLYTGLDVVVQGECDEFQHNGKNGNYLCEQERISEIYDEPGICGKKLAVVRYNPDSYNVPRDKKRLKREERLALTVKLMKHIIEHPEVMKGHIHVFYICYNHDNPKICRDLPVSLLYDEEDLNNL